MDFDANVAIRGREHCEAPADVTSSTSSSTAINKLRKPVALAGGGTGQSNEESDEWADASLNKMFVKQLEQSVPGDDNDNDQLDKEHSQMTKRQETGQIYEPEALYDLECSFEKLYNKGYTPRY